MFKTSWEWNMHAILRVRKFINKDGDLFLTSDSLIRINNIITNSHNLHLRRQNVKPAGYNKQYMGVSRIETELYSLVDKFSDRRITSRTFCDTLLDKIHPFADGNSRTYKILFDDKIESFYKIYKKACVWLDLFFIQIRFWTVAEFCTKKCYFFKIMQCFL